MEASLAEGEREPPRLYIEAPADYAGVHPKVQKAIDALPGLAEALSAPLDSFRQNLSKIKAAPSELELRMAVEFQGGWDWKIVKLGAGATLELAIKWSS